VLFGTNMNRWEMESWPIVSRFNTDSKRRSKCDEGDDGPECKLVKLHNGDW
jgi:hypothetical protein